VGDALPLLDTGGGAGGDAAQAEIAASDADAGAGVADATASDATAPPADAGPCAPSCKGKVCGPDGCGSVCGFCPTGLLCAGDGSACQEFCKPQCDGKACGDNGCGGDCGDCGQGFHCGVDSLCHPDDCVGDCAGKQCGDDGCGKSCGSCATGDLCDPSFQCKPSPCKGIPATGSCSGDILVGCKGSGASASKTQTDCAVQGVPGSKVCGWDPLASAYACIDKPPCAPDCAAPGGGKRECGDDGCGGSCGSCLDGWACGEGACQAKVGGACGGTFNSKTGACDGSSWLFCSSGKIVALDCAKADQTCGWKGSAYGCK
jgi:hypothetical protein